MPEGRSKILSATSKTQHSQINIDNNKKKELQILKVTRDHLEKSHPNTFPRRKHGLRGVKGLVEITQVSWWWGQDMTLSLSH